MTVAFLSERDVDDVKTEVEAEYENLRRKGVTEIEDLSLPYEIVEAKKTPKYIEEMRRGKITLDDKVIQLREGYKREDIRGGYRIEPFGEYEGYQGISYEFHAKQTFSGSSPKCYRNIEKRIKEELAIFEGLEGVGAQWLRLPEVLPFSINVIFTLPIYFKLDLPILNGMDIHLSFKLHKKLQNKLKFQFALRRKRKTIENPSFNIRGLPCREHDGSFVSCNLDHTFTEELAPDDEIIIVVRSNTLGEIYKRSWKVGDLIERKEEFTKDYPSTSTQAFEYDVVLSFAGEDREHVEVVANILKERGVKVFYDKFEEVNLWGKDLYEHFDEIYRRKGRYCVMFISKHYASKVWTTHERRSAQARAFQEQREYILPVKLNDTEVPGIRPTISYVDGKEKSPEQLAEMIIKKLETAKR